MRGDMRRLLRPRHPAQYVTSAFAVAVALFTALLLLPISHAEGVNPDFITALFTATSAVCITGLAVVDTGTYWSPFGKVVILVAIQLGGFGIMTAASLLGLLVSQQMGLRMRLTATADTNTLSVGEITRVVRNVALTMLIVETALAIILFVRFWLAWDQPPGAAAFSGLFHSVNALNQGGLSLYADSLVRFVADPWIIMPVTVAIILGSLGFPVIFELARRAAHPAKWTIHTKITLFATAILLVGGTIMFLAFEWTNPRTLGPMDVTTKLLAAYFQSVTARSAGLNTIDISAMRETTWLGTDVLMFIGGGSAGTAGGIKVTTFMLLLFAIIAEARGDERVDAFGRRIPATAIRQALSVALLGVALVVTGTMFILSVTPLPLDQVLFEVISAFTTTGLSTGITADLPDPAKYALVVLMFVGRTGTVTLASALALRSRRRMYTLPEERPIVG